MPEGSIVSPSILVNRSNITSSSAHHGPPSPGGPRVSFSTPRPDPGPGGAASPAPGPRDPEGPTLSPSNFKASLSWQKAVKSAGIIPPAFGSKLDVARPLGRRASVHVDSLGRKSSFDRSGHLSERRGSLFKTRLNLQDAATISMKKKKNESEEAKKRLQSQVKALQDSYGELQEELEDMRRQYNSLQEKSSGAQAQYERTVKMLDKIRADNKGKVLELSKLRSELQTLGDRMRTLENKAMEVEKLEIAVETLKKSLEAAQQEIRDREREVRQTRSSLERTEKKLEEVENEMSVSKVKSDDLREQVKEELVRNTRLEKRIENTDLMKQQLREKDEKISLLTADAEEKRLIAQHARKCLREEKEKSKDLEEQIRQINRMEQEVMMVRSENHTLKRLMLAKDKLVVQKTQIIANTKNALHSLPPTEPYTSLLRILDNKDTIPATFAGDSNSEEEQENSRPQRPNTAPVTSRNQNKVKRKHCGSQRPSSSTPRPNERSRHHGNGFFMTALNVNHENSSNHVQFMNGLESGDDHHGNCDFNPADDIRDGAKTRIQRPRMYKGSFCDFRSEDGSNENVSICSFMESRNDTHQKLNRGNSLRNSTSSLNSPSDYQDVTSLCSSMSRMTESVPETSEKAERGQHYENHRPTKCVRIGDRVVVNIAKKKDPRRNLQPGVIRYLGDLDELMGSHVTYVGLKLDEPCGDSEGIYKEKRFFRAPARFGKVLPLNKIVSVFDKDAGIYRKVESVTYDPPRDTDVRSVTPSSGFRRPNSLRS